MQSKIGVGIVGGGFVTQAIHLPVLAAYAEMFDVLRVVDIDPIVGQSVANRCGAQYSTDFADILSDSQIDVVAVCSPDGHHAQQVIAACEASKRAVLCEKPLAISMDEAKAIAAASKVSGTAIFVGTMHAYDPAYQAGLRAWRLTGDSPRQIRSAIFLPRNEEFVDQATEMVRTPAAPTVNPSKPAGDRGQIMLRRAMLGLAIHDIPLVRDFQSEVGNLVFAEFLPPFGYALVAAHAECVTELTAVMPGAWPLKWTFEVSGSRHSLRVSMPPSFVMSGSARVELESPDSTRVFSFDQNGYQALWQAIGKTVLDGIATPFEIETLVGDLKFALDLAEGADVLLGAGQ